MNLFLASFAKRVGKARHKYKVGFCFICLKRVGSLFSWSEYDPDSKFMVKVNHLTRISFHVDKMLLFRDSRLRTKYQLQSVLYSYKALMIITTLWF